MNTDAELLAGIEKAVEAGTMTVFTPVPRVCSVCGIGVIPLRLSGLFIHAEPRTLANGLHNGTPDHNAVVETPSHLSHDFTGIDGRCVWCDCRPFSRAASQSCEVR